jgi:hypothetical protein
MEIQARDRWNPQEFARQDLAVRHDHDDIRLLKPQLFDRRCIANPAGLKYRHVMAHGHDFDRRGKHFLVSSHRFVRLSHAGKDVVIFGIDQAVQCGDSDIPGSDENDPHPPGLQNSHLGTRPPGGELTATASAPVTSRVPTLSPQVAHVYSVELAIRQHEQAVARARVVRCRIFGRKVTKL